MGKEVAALQVGVALLQVVAALQVGVALLQVVAALHDQHKVVDLLLGGHSVLRKSPTDRGPAHPPSAEKPLHQRGKA